jgi:methionyl-tRNA formyltransferase
VRGRKMQDNLHNKKIMIVTVKKWNIEEAKKLAFRNKNWKISVISEREKFNFSRVKKFNPDHIFLPHWSWMIPTEVYENYQCIVFHMTDLPFGRGGSPLQNLIERGFNSTKISAIRVSGCIDGGPVYIKRSLSLRGNAHEIYSRAASIVFEKMIPHIVSKNPRSIPQKGKIVEFKKRTPSQGDISPVKDLKIVYDFIRMLDAEGYPPAFLETKHFRVSFTGADFRNGKVTAKAEFRENNGQ